MGKLVRDRIPEIIRAEGREPVVTTDQGMLPVCLKIIEEVEELAAATSHYDQVEELADIFEGLLAAAARLNVDPLEIKLKADFKRKTRGGFDQGYILH